MEQIPKTKEKNGGIRLQRLNRGLLVVTVFLGMALVLMAFSVNRSFRQLEESTRQYMKAAGDTSDMQEASDYLTDRARTFVVTGDVTAAKDFDREVNETKRRDKAVESIGTYLTEQDTANHLADALAASNELASIENYAMALAAKGHGIDPSALPASITAAELSDADLALPDQEQRVKARNMMFDETYQAYKSQIRENVALCQEELSSSLESVQEQCSDQLQKAITTLSILIILVVIVVVAMIFCSVWLFIWPIDRMVSAIEEDKPAEELGAYELRFVSRAYNKARAESLKNQEDLAYTASHDQLTGVYNRGVFEKAKEKNRGRAQAMFIFDVDHFKEFNDTYGHDLGDRVLKKVANAIRSNFRDEDYVCRFGGDEFTVLMVHVTSEMRPLCEKKIEKIRSVCRDTSDGLPKVTLSIGVAFSDRPDPTDDILKDADTALYKTKERGKDGYTFYGDKEVKEEEKMLSIDALTAYGANVKEGLARCMNNEGFYLRLVKMAAKDANFEALEQALADHNLDEGFHAAHALKGVLANLALTPVLEPVAEMTELLRARTDTDYGPLLDRVRKGRAELVGLCGE